MDDQLYADSKCLKPSDVEGELSLETTVAEYTIEEVTDEIYFLNFEVPRANKFLLP